ncbi:hypothetical protein PVAND_011559 [Polypedilum vanderplanki]|uniref:Nuclear speckle splicing regulatory protein 1 N-terminal domain-containing protein n=1 Tax=Polypedilum vanderplanki TaxID=319348 RepID=A0A9J6CJZ6_POLVA|nr:hypothetical protein PVAND_011559 [Polypedilum vanderplanki]
MAKQYGLIKPDKSVKNVFGSNSDSDDDTPAKKFSSIANNALKQKQFKQMHEQAMAEDASVFQYDEVYDDIQAKRNEAKLAKKTQEAKKPKYIGKLLETAEQRKKEYERRVERQVQKEREAEGEQFKDKESFVTSAYRQKLEEMKIAEEKEKREAYLESIGDVRKQSDLSGFYRHLYSQKIGDDDKIESKIKDVSITKSETVNKKNYRKRKSSDDDEQINEDEKKPDQQMHIQSNLDADSDFSIESSDDEEDKSKTKNKSIKKEPKSDEEMKPPSQSSSVNETIIKKESPAKENVDNNIEIKTEPDKPKKEKIDIWKKRTVGEIFDQALQRYFERKAIREQSR